MKQTFVDVTRIGAVLERERNMQNAPSTWTFSEVRKQNVSEDFTWLFEHEILFVFSVSHTILWAQAKA